MTASRHEILAAGFLPADAMAELERHYRVHRYFEAADKPGMLAEVAGRIQVMVGTSHATMLATLINALPALQLIAIYGTGYEKIEVDAAFARGIALTNTPDVMTDDVADLAIGLLIATVRRICTADRFVRAGRCAAESMPFAHSMRGQHLGIVGLGRIGRKIAQRAAVFGMTISYHGPHAKTDTPYTYYPKLIDLARDADSLLLTLPGGPTTHHLINSEILEAIGPDGTLINVARGPIVDETALVDALRDGRLGAAALDVFADLTYPPEGLFDLENVVLSPHRGSATFESRGAMARLFLENVHAFFAGQPLLTKVSRTLR